MLLKPLGGGPGMTPGCRILVATQSQSLVGLVFDLFDASEHEVVVTSTFSAAKHHLSTKPHVLITEVKLGEYNGLHLAMRARAAGVRSIVVGGSDQEFERQAQQLGAVYVDSADLLAEQLQALVEGVVDDHTSQDHRVYGGSPIAETSLVDPSPIELDMLSSLTARPDVIH